MNISSLKEKRIGQSNLLLSLAAVLVFYPYLATAQSETQKSEVPASSPEENTPKKETVESPVEKGSATGKSFSSAPDDSSSPTAYAGEAEEYLQTPEEEVVVTATRFDTVRGNVPASVSLVSAKEANARPATNADDLIRANALVDGQRYQGMANAYPHVLCLRGIRGPDRLLVMLDDQPINNALNGFPNLNLLPVDRIQRIEVVRGPFSALYGSRAMAGVINIITERGGEEPGIRFQSGLGPFGFYLVRGSVAGDSDPLEYTLTFDRHQTDNYLGKSEEPNVDYQHYRLHGRIDLFRKQRLSATFTGGIFRSSMGFNQYVDLRETPGLGFWIRNEGRSSMDDDWSQLTLNWKPLSTLEIRLIGSLLHHDQTFHSIPVLLEGQFPAGYVPDPERVTSHSVAYRSEALARWLASDWLTLVVGGELVRDVGDWRTFDLDEGLLKTGMEAAATTAAGFVQLENNFFENRLVIIGGARLDYHSTFGAAFSPKIGVSAQVRKGTTLRCSFGRAFRSPSLTELYQPAWQRIPPYLTVGNENLRPEILYSVDAGLEQRLFKHTTVKVTGFYNHGRDFITLRLQSDNKEHYLNLEKIHTAGLEVESAAELNKNIRILASYVFTYSENVETGQPLDYVPEHLGGISLQATVPVGSSHLECAFDMRLVGSRQFAQARSPEARGELSPYAMGNLRLQWVLKPVTFFADFYNVWNAHYYENEGIEVPGFIFLAGVRVNEPWPDN